MVVPTVGPNRAQAWIVTVIDPIVRRLQVERHYLSLARWTWRFHRKRCELLLSSYEIVGGLYDANLDDLARRVPRLALTLKNYDVALQSLVEVLTRAQERLELLPSFLSAVEEARAAHSVNHPEDPRPTGAFDPGMLHAVCAEYVLNDYPTSEPELADSTMRLFWPANAARLSAEGRAEREATLQPGRVLLAAVDRTMAEFSEFKFQLCDQFDVPPVPIQ